MMVVHESFVTRKPLEFTLIILVIVLIILIPIYLYSEHTKEDRVKEEVLIAETYNEVDYRFSPESDLSESDKKHLFEIDYEGNFVQWTGTMLSCDGMNGLFRVSVDEMGDGFGDVLFTTFQDCTGIAKGSTIVYKIRLIDWKITTFIGSDGEILRWE